MFFWMPSKKVNVVVLAMVGLVLGGCASERPDEPVGRAESAMIAGDCPGYLDGCYTSCQAVTPSPEAQCFSNCDVCFGHCLSGAPASKCSVNSPSP
jgi:hypothetical protein